MPADSIRIADVMTQSGVGFGTSGARGPAGDMTDRVCYAYTAAFLRVLEAAGDLPKGRAAQVAVAGDFRPSTPRIEAAVMRAIRDGGHEPAFAGRVPTPAVTYFGLMRGMPSIMVTGSHIPEDRNGIKFNKRAGEILKPDEEAIRAQAVSLPPGLFAPDGRFARGQNQPTGADADAAEVYRRRYLEFFASDLLAGLKVGFYQHSAVGRELLPEILEALGATVLRLGYSEEFLPVDTEAVRPEDEALALQWTREHGLDALCTTDGDSDRPMLADERGQWLRGDVSGILTAQFLGARSVTAPVSCNTALEKSGLFPHTRRTRIGSPYVIEGMQAEEAAGRVPACGYEANGGFLIQSPVEVDGKRLSPLPTRDTAIVFAAVLGLARRDRRPLSALAAALPPRYTASGRLKNFAAEKSAALLVGWRAGSEAENRRALEATFGKLLGKVAAIDTTDGLRVVWQGGDVAHFRPSGNAPELRCYSESDTPPRARDINRKCLEILEGLR